MKLFALFFALSLVFAHFEVTEDREPSSEHPGTKRPDPDEWSDHNLLQNRVIRLTDDLFDQQINEKPWLIFFVFDRHNPTNTLQYVYQLLTQVAAQSDGVQVAFVDVLDEGELLKETFDIDRQPACVYVKDRMVYYMPANGGTVSWTAADLTNFI